MLRNLDIRKTAKSNGVFLWQIADALGVSEPTLTRRLRYELPDSDRTKILAIIDDLANKKASA